MSTHLSARDLHRSFQMGKRKLEVLRGVSIDVQPGEAIFLCKDGKIPSGMIFVPYGPPTCKLMGQITDGTGMPTSKGWEVEVEPIANDPQAQG